jgi:copper homeostasis protein
VSPLLEVCVDGIDDARIAAEAGADRIELCAALSEGGLTPSPGTMAAAASLPVPVVAMIRPRGGDFRFSPAEEAVMARDIAAAREAGLAGIVLGASDAGDRLDAALLARLIEAAAPLPVTLHRAFDLAPDPHEALETAFALGFARILTSGGQPRAADGAAAIADLAARAAGRIAIMPGGGITAANAAGILRRTGAREIHASCGAVTPGSPRAVALGFEPASGRRRTNRDAVSALRQELDRAAAILSKTIPIP